MQRNSRTVNWDNLTDKIENEKCVLLLGPEFPFIGNEKNHLDALQTYLESERVQMSMVNYEQPATVTNDGSLIKYYKKDELFYFENEFDRSDVYYYIKKFFSDLKPHKYYKKIAKLPFHLIISLSPDLHLKNTFKELEFTYDFDFYHKKKNPQAKEPPKKARPLIYNLLGSIDEEESLIYTYHDLFDYFAVVFERKLPETVRKSLKECTGFIFLGFEFEKWYMRLLLKILQLQDKKIRSHSHFIENPIKSFYTDHFQVEFEEIMSEQFIETLYTKCERKNILRSPSKWNVIEFKKKLHEVFGEADYITVINELKKYASFFSNTLMFERLLSLSAAYNRAQTELRHSLIKHEDYTTAMAKISLDLLTIIDELE